MDEEYSGHEEGTIKSPFKEVRRLGGFPVKGEELVGLIDGQMVKYRVMYVDIRSHTVRLEIWDTKEAPAPHGVLGDVLDLVHEAGAPARGELRPSEDVVHNYWNRLLGLLGE